MGIGCYMSNKQFGMLKPNYEKKEYLFEIKEGVACDFNNTPINSYCIIVLLIGVCKLMRLKL